MPEKTIPPQMSLETQIVDTWRIHQATMLLLLDSIPEGGLKATRSPRGGRDIARQLAHVNNVRVSRLAAFARREGTKIEPFPDGMTNETSPDAATLRAAFVLSGDMMQRYIIECLEKGSAPSNFKIGVVQMIGYYISHEAHHRGHLIQVLRECGFRIGDALKFEVWNWTKL